MWRQESMRVREHQSVENVMRGFNSRIGPWFIAVLCILSRAFGNIWAYDERPIERGDVVIAPTAADSSVAERFRLNQGTFAWEAQRMGTVTESLEVWEVRFPSPVTTADV